MINAFELAKKFLKDSRLIRELDGALVGGSWARGEGVPKSDIDILVIYKPKFSSHFEKVHSKETSFKGYPVSLIFQSKKTILNYLKDPDPSVISFLREGVIIYDPTGFLSKSTKRAKSLKIFKDDEWKRESKRRLQERINYNLIKIQQALSNKDKFMATYLLRGILDEVVEKLRMYDEDWLYSQRKSNFKYLNRSLKRNKTFTKIFNLANSPLQTETLKNLISLLKNYPVR